MMSKYYTPEIEEFHEGFSHEYKGPLDTKWHKEDFKLKGPNPNISWFVTEGHFRVKFLDREDIESFGWENDEAWQHETRRFLYHKKCTTPRGKHNCSIFHVPYTNWVMIYFSTGEFGSYVWELPEDKITFTGGTAFAGVIKNKSELKVLLKQLGI